MPAVPTPARALPLETPPAPPPSSLSGKPQAAGVDSEYVIGARVLPRVGAAVLSLGIAYLVSLGVARGVIGPRELFAGVCILCVAFILLGQIKRGEREQYGDILTGVGSCGLFLNFVGGHLWQKLYGGETMVALFVALSLANLAFSLWRRSTAFLGIGLAGGLAASLMPLQQGNHGAATALHFAVFLPAALVAAHHRWPAAALAVGSAALLSTIGVAFAQEVPWRFASGVVYATVIVGLLALATSSRARNDSLTAGAVGLVVVGSVMGAAQEPSSFTYSVGIFGLLIAALGAALRTHPLAAPLMGVGVLVAGGFAPWALPLETASLLMLALAAVWVAVAWRYGRQVGGLAGIQLLIAAAAHLARLGVSESTVPLGEQLAFLASFGVLAALLGRRLQRESPAAEPAGLIASGLAVSRMLYLALVDGVGLGASAAVTVSLISLGIFWLAIGFPRKSRELRLSGLAATGCALAKVLLFDLATSEPVIRVSLLMGLGVAMLAGGYWYVRQHGPRSE